MKKVPPLVLVTWEDASVKDEGAWADNDSDHTYVAKVFQTVGFLLHDGPEGIVLTDSWHEDTVGARDQIPRGMIRSMKRLKA
jgi:hypothetical protein